MQRIFISLLRLLLNTMTNKNINNEKLLSDHRYEIHKRVIIFIATLKFTLFIHKWNFWVYSFKCLNFLLEYFRKFIFLTGYWVECFLIDIIYIYMYEYVCFHSILYEASKSIVKLDHHLLACKKTPQKTERVTIWFVNFSLRLPLIYIIVNRVASVYFL